MTQISFTLNDESKLKMILNWLKNQDAVRDIVTEPNTLTTKQLEMKKDLERAYSTSDLVVIVKKSLDLTYRFRHGERKVSSIPQAPPQ